MPTCVVYIWQDREKLTGNVAIVSSEDKKFINALCEWCEEQGLGITKRELRLGPEHT